ncbi:hypothetical protein ABZW32_21695 [Streptomyces sp. NPDC004667]|uniref:hypothetical protein n=1 Tax=Streptomyces sp. NPDC004667 TaxID=3154285 RepID=UPI0033ABEA72
MPVDHQLDMAALERALRAELDGEVRFDAGSRGAYATDGSNYRQVPLGVVVPRSVDAGAAAVAVCSRFALPLSPRPTACSCPGTVRRTPMPMLRPPCRTWGRTVPKVRRTG